jgi:hypothetical protein
MINIKESRIGIISHPVTANDYRNLSEYYDTEKKQTMNPAAHAPKGILQAERLQNGALTFPLDAIYQAIYPRETH